MTAQEVVNAEPLPVSETVALGQPGLSPDDARKRSVSRRRGLVRPKKASRRPIRSMRNCWRRSGISCSQNNDADLYLADQIAELQKLVISLQTGQTIVAESHENRMNELAQKIDAISEPTPVTITQIPSTSSTDVPPFRLIAIDRWENEWNAVLELNGKISMLVAAIRTSWLETAADIPAKPHCAVSIQ